MRRGVEGAVPMFLVIVQGKAWWMGWQHSPQTWVVLRMLRGVRGAGSGVSELTQAGFETFWYFLCPSLCCPSSFHSCSWV